MTRSGRTAAELELDAAAAPHLVGRVPLPAGEAMAMLARRGLRPKNSKPDLPFPADLADETADVLAERLRHYAFRLFFRGAIQKAEGFSPEQASRYLSRPLAQEYAEFLAGIGLAKRLARGRFRLRRPARSFGGTLEWYVAHELHRRFAFDAATGVKCRFRGVGGDLDVVAAAEGKLVYLELKSSPPKNLAVSEVTAFFDRLLMLRPDLSLFVVDTALRLSDKVLPMLVSEIGRRTGEGTASPTRISRQLWALTPRLYAVNGHPDLVANIGRAIAEGLRSLHSPL